MHHLLSKSFIKRMANPNLVARMSGSQFKVISDFAFEKYNALREQLVNIVSIYADGQLPDISFRCTRIHNEEHGFAVGVPLSEMPNHIRHQYAKIVDFFDECVDITYGSDFIKIAQTLNGFEAYVVIEYPHIVNPTLADVNLPVFKNAFGTLPALKSVCEYRHYRLEGLSGIGCVRFTNKAKGSLFPEKTSVGGYKRQQSIHAGCDVDTSYTHTYFVDFGFLSGNEDVDPSSLINHVCEDAIPGMELPQKLSRFVKILKSTRLEKIYIHLENASKAKIPAHAHDQLRVAFVLLMLGVDIVDDNGVIRDFTLEDFIKESCRVKSVRKDLEVAFEYAADLLRREDHYSSISEAGPARRYVAVQLLIALGMAKRNADDLVVRTEYGQIVRDMFCVDFL